MQLVVKVYHLLKKYPSDERFLLTAQTKDASVSIPSNIAEGSGRKSNKEFAYFLSVAHGSASELDTELTLAWMLKYITEEEYEDVIQDVSEVKRLIEALTDTIFKNQKKSLKSFVLSLSSFKN